MKLEITPRALSIINDIAAFVESKNTKGSGKRYILKFIKDIKKMAQPKVEYSVCNHPALAKYNYSCRFYNDWVIVFKVRV